MNSLTILRRSPALFKHPRDEAAAARAGNRNRRDTDPDRGASIDPGRARQGIACEHAAQGGEAGSRPAVDAEEHRETRIRLGSLRAVPGSGAREVQDTDL